MEKTNVMRLLDSAGAEYTPYEYPSPTALSGAEVASLLGKDPSSVFKTLVTVGSSGKHYVFMLPVLEELHLKKAAKAAGEKSIEMIKSKDLLPMTGYIHGGCSPIGMKKPFPTFVDETVILCDRIMFSAGKIGYQVEMTPETFLKVFPYETADLTQSFTKE